MQNIIIECREAEAQVNNNAGDWSTKIQEHVVVEEGDEITIRNVFIDTEATESEKIVIPFDIELKLSNYKYLIDWAYLDYGPRNAEYKDTFITPLSNIFPNKKLCIDTAAEERTDFNDFSYMDDNKQGRPGVGGLKQISTGGPFIMTTRHSVITTDLLQTVLIGSKSSNSDFGNCILEITYTDPNNNVRTRHMMIPLYPAGSGQQTLQPSILCKENTERTYNFFVSGNPKSPFTIKNTIFVSETVETQHAKATALPIVADDTITIPKGNYDPDDLTVILNREMNKNTPIQNTANSSYVDSPYLSIVTSKANSNHVEFYPILDQGYPFTIDPSFNNDDATDNFINYYVGASKLEIAYIPSSKQFSWNYMHMPYYDGPSEATVYYNLLNGLTHITANGGIMWEGLQAKNKATGEPFDFWSNIMGFELEGVNNILVESQYVDDGAGILRPRIQNYANGITVTSGFSGIDSAILKTPANTDQESAALAPFFASPLGIPTASSKNSGGNPTIISATVTNGLPSTVTKTDPIIGKSSSLNHQDSYGYFLLEVQAKFANEFIGKENNFNFIKSIISRFYSIDSYTSGTAQDSVVYIHKGEPMLLDSFNIRVLEPDKQLATNIGNDNSVYIQVVKPPKIKSN